MKNKTLSAVFIFAVVQATAQQPGAPPAGPGARPPVEIDKTAPVEDFKPSALNQPGKQFPK